MEGILFTLPDHIIMSFIVLIVLMLMNTVAAVVKVNLKNNDVEVFDWSYLPDFLMRDFQQQILPLIVPALAGWILGGEFYAMFYAMATPIAISFVARFFSKLEAIYNIQFKK